MLTLLFSIRSDTSVAFYKVAGVRDPVTLYAH